VPSRHVSKRESASFTTRQVIFLEGLEVGSAGRVPGAFLNKIDPSALELPRDKHRKVQCPRRYE